MVYLCYAINARLRGRYSPGDSNEKVKKKEKKKEKHWLLEKHSKIGNRVKKKKHFVKITPL